MHCRKRSNVQLFYISNVRSWNAHFDWISSSIFGKPRGQTPSMSSWRFDLNGDPSRDCQVGEGVLGSRSSSRAAYDGERAGKPRPLRIYHEQVKGSLPQKVTRGTWEWRELRGKWEKKKNPEFGRERNILGICQKSRDRHETRGAWKERRGRRPREVNSLLLKSTNHCRSLLEELAVLRLFWEDLDSIHSVAAGWQPRAFYSTHPNAPSWVFPNVSCTWTKLAVIDTFRESAL